MNKHFKDIGAQSTAPTQSHLHLLVRASCSASEFFTRKTGEMDITPSQLIVLSIIASDPGLSQKAISDASRIDRTTISTIVQLLSRKGLLERKRCTKDCRMFKINLTPQGQHVLETLTPVVKFVDDCIARAAAETGDIGGFLQLVSTKPEADTWF